MDSLPTYHYLLDVISPTKTSSKFFFFFLQFSNILEVPHQQRQHLTQSSDTKDLITQAPNNDLSTFLLFAETTSLADARPP